MSCQLGIYLITLLHAVGFVQRSFDHSNTKQKENKRNKTKYWTFTCFSQCRIYVLLVVFRTVADCGGWAKNQRNDFFFIS